MRVNARIYPWYLLACHVIVAVGDSGLALAVVFMWRSLSSAILHTCQEEVTLFLLGPVLIYTGLWSRLGSKHQLLIVLFLPPSLGSLMLSVNNNNKIIKEEKYSFSSPSLIRFWATTTNKNKKEERAGQDPRGDAASKKLYYCVTSSFINHTARTRWRRRADVTPVALPADSRICRQAK